MKLLSRVRLLATFWTAAYQAPPSMGFFRQEYWSGLSLASLLNALVSLLFFIRYHILLQLQFIRSVVSDSVQPHRWQPNRLPHPWDSPDKNTAVGCHFLLQCMKVKSQSESEVAQSCPTPSDPMDCSLPGSSVHGIFQVRILEWGAIAFSGRYI